MTNKNLFSDEIYKYIKKTPIFTNDDLNKKYGLELFFKCENLQITGSFKYRGACNAVLSLLSKEKKPKGVITVSSGNHGAGLAKAGKVFAVKTHVLVPKNSSPAKIANIKRYGAEISYCGNDPRDRKAALEQKQQEIGYHFISPYDDIDVIHGQSSVAQEILDEIKDLDAIISPVGGGGLISGTILARDKKNKQVKIFAAEPQGANDAFLSLKSGKLQVNENVNTICDGLRANLGEITFPIIKNGVQEIITVSDDEVLKAMEILWENLKIIVEPSSATTFAALIKNAAHFKGQKIALILTGGNVVLDKIMWQR